MSETSVRHEIDAKRAYAARLEARANDTAHPFSHPSHREHLLHEAARMRREADQEEEHLAHPRHRRAFH